MLCEICHQNPATIHIQEICGTERKTLHLCQACAEKKAQEDSTMQGFNLAEVLLQLSGHGHLSPEKLANLAGKVSDNRDKIPEEYSKIFCGKCGWDYASSVKTGKMGCPECYKAFAEVLKNGINAMHKGNVHHGKKPLSSGSGGPVQVKPSGVLIKLNISRLQTALEDAVAGEKYEEAAVLRDRINSLKKELAETEGSRNEGK